MQDMEHSPNDAASMDAQIMLEEEECAEGTGHIAILMMNLLHSLYHVNQHLMIRPQLFPICARPLIEVLPTI